MAPVSASNSLPVPSKIVMKGNSTMTLHERFSDISPPKIEKQEKIVDEPTVTARLDIGRSDFFTKREPSRRGADFYEDENENFSPQRRRNGSSSMKNRRERTPQFSRNRGQLLSRRSGASSRNSLYEALRDRRTNLKQRLGAKGRLGLGGGGGGFRSDADDFRQRPPMPPSKVSPFDDLDTIFRFQRMNGVFRNNNRTRSRFTYRGFQKRRFGYRRNGFSRFQTPRFRNNRRFGNNSTFRFAGSKFQPQQQQKASKEELDDEIDAYMAKTKLNLDNDLDVYMADV